MNTKTTGDTMAHDLRKETDSLGALILQNRQGSDPEGDDHRLRDSEEGSRQRELMLAAWAAVNASAICTAYFGASSNGSPLVEIN